MKINEKNLCVFAKTPPYDMEGFLNKRGEVNKAFQRRYFILKGNLLFYFESRMDKEPLGLIIVEGCTIELSNEVDSYCFEIAFNGNRTYILSAENQGIMETWMKALTCAGYEYKRIIVSELQRLLHEKEEARNKTLGNFACCPTVGIKPMPPPRRTNPFNRPAPSAPDSSLQAGMLMSPIPFINGYFGTSHERQQQEHLMITQDANGNRSSHGMPKVLRRLPHTHPISSGFHTETLDQGSTILQIRNKNTHTSSVERRSRALEEFARTHEQFRQKLMPDVSAYRERHGQPLIQL
ncbi:hypothetical protein KR009_008989 [Drosophila setifemur]|nr:hypothetical protein KR009_008989 [Drosophila setifemur]